jgi:hypothetical protein
MAASVVRGLGTVSLAVAIAGIRVNRVSCCACWQGC